MAIKNTKNRLGIVKKTPKLFNCTDNSFYLIQALNQKSPITKSSTPFFRKFHKLTDKLDAKIVEVRELFQNKTTDGKTGLERLKEVVLKYKTGNCFEQSFILRDEFSKAGLDSKVVHSTWFDHSFLIVNLDKNAHIENPKTWGKKAFIADAWLGKVFRNTNEALTEYKRMWLLSATEIRNMKKNKLASINTKHLKKSTLAKLQFDLFKETSFPI